MTGIAQLYQFAALRQWDRRVKLFIPIISRVSGRSLRGRRMDLRLVAPFTLALSVAIADPPTAQANSCTATGNHNSTCEGSFTVKAGGSVTIAPGITTFRNTDCSFLRPTIHTLVAPRKGHLIPAIVPRVITDTSNQGSAGSCAGRPTKGLRIDYVANRNTSGTDQIVLILTYAPSPAYTNTMTMTYNITVQ